MKLRYDGIRGGRLWLRVVDWDGKDRYYAPWRLALAFHRRNRPPFRPVSLWPEFGWKWLKWTFGWWSDPENRTFFGIDAGPLEIVWRLPGYRP